MSETKIIQIDENELKYEFRLNLAVVMFTNVTDSRLPELADKLNKCESVQAVVSFHRYDTGLASIIVHMKIGYNREAAEAEFENSFNDVVCQTTVAM